MTRGFLHGAVYSLVLAAIITFLIGWSADTLILFFILLTLDLISCSTYKNLV